MDMVVSAFWEASFTAPLAVLAALAGVAELQPFTAHLHCKRMRFACCSAVADFLQPQPGE